MNEKTLTFPVPETLRSATLNNTSDGRSEVEVGRNEVAQLRGEMLHLGNWLDSMRAQALTQEQSNTVFAGLRGILGKKTTRNSLIQNELTAAGNLFATAPGHKYDFFYYGPVDEAQEWIFHDWTGSGREATVITTRYLVYPDGVFRASDNQPYREVSADELDRLWKATNNYYAKVRPLYSSRIS